MYKELFRSEFDKNYFYEQKTYLSIQTTVSAQKQCISISRIDFIDKESVSCANTVFYLTAYCTGVYKILVRGGQ